MGEPALHLLLRTIAHLVLIMLPAFALAAIAARNGMRHPVSLGLVVLAGTAVPGYVVFWVWFLVPPAGRPLAFLIPLASIACLWVIVRKLDGSARSALRVPLIPALLTGASALFILSLGFLYGGTQDPIATGETRFSHTLPKDNLLPFLLAEGISDRNIPKPFFIDWKSSDRPPLQAAIVLTQYPFTPRPRVLGYTVSSVILQSLWIFGLWLLLTSLHLPPRLIALVLITCQLTGFVLVNSFFVWPKLLAAAYILGFLALVLELARGAIEWPVLEITGGALLAFGMLSHGGVIFALFGAAPLGVVLVRRVALRRLALVVGVAAALYIPWTLYQKFYDPPGDRLLKFNLANTEQVDSRPFGETLIAAYKKLTPRQIVELKLGNLAVATGRKEEFWLTLPGLLSVERSKVAAQLRGLIFFYFLPCLGFLMLGPIAWLAALFKAFRGTAWRAASLLWLIVALTVVVWCVLLFNSSSAVVHLGSYVMVLIAMAASLLSFWAVSPLLSRVIALLQIALGFVAYVLLMPAPGPISYPLLILCLLSVGALLLLLFRPASIDCPA